MTLHKPAGFSLAIADIKVQAICNRDHLASIMSDRYRDFQSEIETAFKIEIEWDDQDRERTPHDAELIFQDGILRLTTPGYHGFVDVDNMRGQLRFTSTQPFDDVDYYLRLVFALLAHINGGVLFHTAGVIKNGYAYLFFGHSGSGKTTICRVSSPDHTVLNDDLILLLPTNDSWEAFGTPFWNPSQVKPVSKSAPVASMYLLTQAKEVAVHNLTSSQAIAAMIANTPIIPEDPIRSSHLIDILMKIKQCIPVLDLHFLPDNSFWEVI